VPRRVAGHVDDAEIHAQHAQRVATGQRGEGLGNALARRAVHRGAGGVAQRRHAAGVIAVVVRD